MYQLIRFIQRNFHWFLFVAFEAVAFVMLFSRGYQSSLWVSSANSVAGVVYDMQSAMNKYLALVENNKDLTMRNIYLEHRVNTLTEELERQGYDSLAITKLKNDSVRNLIPAAVVGNSVNQIDNFITIDKGTADGVKKDMGVISGKGVVGIVYLAGTHYSVVIPVLSSKSNISCMVERRGYFGYLHWGGGATNIAYVDDVPRHAHLKIGDRIVTSGYSSVFPPGIAVGKVMRIMDSKDGISYRLKVKLYTDFGNLRDVCVIDNTQMEEKIDVLRQAQDSIQLVK